MANYEFRMTDMASMDALIMHRDEDHAPYHMAMKTYMINAPRKEYRDDPNSTNDAISAKTYDLTTMCLYNGSLDDRRKVVFFGYSNEGHGDIYRFPMIFYSIKENNLLAYRTLSTDMTSGDLTSTIDRISEERPQNITELYKLNPSNYEVQHNGAGSDMPDKGEGVTFPQPVVAINEKVKIKGPIDTKYMLNLSNYFVFDIDMIRPYMPIFIHNEQGLNGVIITDEDGLIISHYDYKDNGDMYTYVPEAVITYHGYKLTSDIKFLENKPAKYIWVSLETLDNIVKRMKGKDILLIKYLHKWKQEKGLIGHPEDEGNHHGYSHGYEG